MDLLVTDIAVAGGYSIRVNDASAGERFAWLSVKNSATASVTREN